MSNPVYEPIARMSRRKINAALKSDDPEVIWRALLSAALYSGDGKWAETLAYKFIDHEHPHVRGHAMSSLGHIAGLNSTLDRQRAIDELRVARNDRHEFVRGTAKDVLEEVQHFMKRNGRWIGQET